MKEILKKPSAWLPIAMSTTALLLVLVYLAIFGYTQPQPHDEGVPARIFQLLLAGQLPIMILFSAKWLPQKPKEVLIIIALQTFTALIPFTTVYFLEL
jgi:hypothetical protein